MAFSGPSPRRAGDRKSSDRPLLCREFCHKSAEWSTSIRNRNPLWAHDMVCTTKGIDVILLIEVRGSRSASRITWRGMPKWARTPHIFGWTFTLVWVSWLVNSRRNFTRRAFLEARFCTGTDPERHRKCYAVATRMRTPKDGEPQAPGRTVNSKTGTAARTCRSSCGKGQRRSS
jgi:hypothetical protein